MKIESRKKELYKKKIWLDKQDSWGRHATTDNSEIGLGQLNPFRYRSYYYAQETCLYFLKSRYYDPTVGRFINSDEVSYIAPEMVDGLNLYTYCGNNPIMRVDSNGNSWEDLVRWSSTFWNKVTNAAAAVMSATFAYKNFWVDAGKAIGGALLTAGKVIGGAALAIVGTAITMGTLPFAILSPGGGFLTQLEFSTAMYGGFIVGSVFDSTIKTDMQKIGWNPFNSNEDLVLKSNKVSFY